MCMGVCRLFQVKAASVLFVDNPVGTGFSYTDRPDGYATNVATVASDMLVLLKQFFTKRAEFQVCQLDPHNCLGGCTAVWPYSNSPKGCWFWFIWSIYSKHAGWITQIFQNYFWRNTRGHLVTNNFATPFSVGCKILSTPKWNVIENIRESSCLRSTGECRPTNSELLPNVFQLERKII